MTMVTSTSGQTAMIAGTVSPAEFLARNNR